MRTRLVRGTREGTSQRIEMPDTIAAALVESGDVEYIDQPAEEVKPDATSKRRATRSTARGTGRKPSGRGSSASNGSA